MVIPSTNSSLGQFRDSINVDPFGKTKRSSSNSSAYPLFGTSSPFRPPMAASVSSENKSSTFGSTSSHFAGYTSIQNQGNALQQSNSHFGPSTASIPPNQTSFGHIDGLAFGTTTAALISDSSVKRPFDFGSAGSVGDISVDQAPRNSGSGASTMTIFGAPNNLGNGFKPTPRVLHSNLAHSSTSSIFGVSSSDLGINIFGFPSPSAFQLTTTPGYGINSRPSFWSASSSAESNLSGSKSSPPLGSPSTSHFPVSTTSSFTPNSAPAPANHSIFGIQSSSGYLGTTKLGSLVGDQHQRSIVVPYSATREVHGANSGYSVGKIQSISAMPIYKDKSHEELRLEDYDLGCKDGHIPWGDQSSVSFCFKTFDTPTNIFRFPTLPNHSSVNPPFSPFKSDFSVSKSQASIMPNNTISVASTLSPSVIPFSHTNLYPSQSQANIPQPHISSSMPIFTRDMNPSSVTPFSVSMPTDSFPSPPISSTLTSASLSTISSVRPSFLVTPSIQSTSVTALAPGVSVLNASQPEHLPEQVESISKQYLSQPSQSLSMLTEVGSQNINGQQYTSPSTASMKSSLVMNPFAVPSVLDQSSAATPIQCGISSLPVSDKLSSNRKTSLLRIRHVSLRHNSLLPAQKHKYGSNEPRVPFFSDKKDRRDLIAPLLPRENPRAWVTNSLPRQEYTLLHSYADGKICENKACPNSSFQLNTNPAVLTDDASIQGEDLSAIMNSHQDAAAAGVTAKHKTDILSLMPKLPDGDYYTEPPIKELEAKERAEPGYCSRVNDFVVGRQGYGSIKFLGETDVRCLNLESIVQFNNHEVIVYADDRKRPSVGQSLNKPAEVTLLNIKCIRKRTGKQYVDGPWVHRYKEMLIKKTAEQGAEFVSYDPFLGEWKFMVKHF